MQRRKVQRRKNGREMLCITVIVLVLIAVVAVQGNRLRKKNAAYEEKMALLNEQIAEESERSEEIEELKEYVNSQEYAGQAAREKLGMAGEDEILFKAEE